LLLSETQLFAKPYDLLNEITCEKTLAVGATLLSTTL